MSKQTEALKLALEALEEIHPGNMTPMAEEAWNKAITAIREALMSVPDGAQSRSDVEQPAQQPVAMRYDFDGYGYKYIDAGSGSDWQTRIKDAEPVYASPQPAQQQEHITDGTPCWCNPVLDYKDPDTGAEVWIHKEPQ